MDRLPDRKLEHHGKNGLVYVFGRNNDVLFCDKEPQVKLVGELHL